MQEATIQTALLDAVMRVIARRDHPLAAVYRTLVGLATRHHAILVDEPVFGMGTALGKAVAAEVLGVPLGQLEQHPDYVFLRSDGLLITNDFTKELIGRVSTSPNGDRRVVLWEDISRMNTSSANSFLKTLEEPDSKTLFLLTAPQAERMLQTILSRVISVQISDAILRDVTEALIVEREDADHLMQLSLGKPSLAAALMMESGQKHTPLTSMLENCHSIAEHLLSENPKDKLTAYGAILAYKDLESSIKKKSTSLLLPLRPFPLLCFVVEGTIEKKLHSTMMVSLSQRAQEIASRILRFRQDTDASVSLKLAALDLVFGYSKDSLS